MATDSYHNYTSGDEFNFQKDPYRFAQKREQLRQGAQKAYPGVQRDFNRMNPGEQKQIRNKLKNMQKKSPSLAKALAAKKPSAIVGLAKNLRRQVRLSTDWMFILLFSLGLLKDIFDIAFAALGAIPIIGIAGTAIGIIVSFVGNLMFLILTATVLVLVGSSIKNRGLAKYFVGTAMEFIAEALPGISWLPWTPVYVLVLYLFVLFDRTYQEQAVQSEDLNVPAYGTADGYEERLAA